MRGVNGLLNMFPLTCISQYCLPFLPSRQSLSSLTHVYRRYPVLPEYGAQDPLNKFISSPLPPVPPFSLISPFSDGSRHGFLAAIPAAGGYGAVLVKVCAHFSSFSLPRHPFSLASSRRPFATATEIIVVNRED